MTRSGGLNSGSSSAGRGVTAVLGPTNTGKTHLAIERMLAHDVGIIGLPLRLLAREVYDKVVARIGAGQVALITGEEKIKPPSPRYYVCTVEAMPLDLEADFVAIDEIQLAADAERGHVFTDRLLHCRGIEETLLLGASTMRDAVRELLPAANLISRPRLSKLSYAGDKKLTRLPRRSAVVAFSASDVYAIAELVRRQRGGAAVVLGALSPRTRNAQVELYQNGDVDFLVATDAIGMGLNLDVDHVAFAGIRKFDGQNHRNLTPAELGQIAGRAGRHLNDGTFGVTGQVAPFDPDLVDRLEQHSFDQLGLLQWRNRKLDYSSLNALKESLREMPRQQRLVRSRMVDDVIALESLAQDQVIADLARGPAGVRLLWDMCQIPDYRKISAVSHAEMIATLYRFVMSDAARIPADWFAEQVGQADRTDGDLDTLSARLAQIRTWTFVSNRSDWLEDPEHWQGRTRAIEDTLSDALHERLTQRFVDRRTSALMRRLRDKEEFAGEIGEDGKIVVENHYVGRIDGFRFTPDAGGDGIHGKAARNAATKVLARELVARLDALAAAPDAAIELARDGRISWRNSEIARLERGDTPLKPVVQLMVDEHLGVPDRERMQKRLDAWLAAHLSARLQPLLALGAATDLAGLARGLAYRLAENFGVLRREAVADELKALDQAARAQLRQYGTRFGAFNIYIPSLLKPAAADILLTLWGLYAGREHGMDLAAMPARPQQGLTSVAADHRLPQSYWHAAGFQIAGTRAIRIDMLERLSDLIRVRLSWKSGEEAKPQPSGAVGDGSFTVVPELMSIVGCSGEDFASILKALGFKRERRPAPPVAQGAAAPPEAASLPVAEETVLAASVAADTALSAEAAASASMAEHSGVDSFEQPDPAADTIEVWRPARRKETAAEQNRHPKAKRSRDQQQRRAPHQPRKAPPRERTEWRAPPSSSPFAALEQLRQAMRSRPPERG